VDVFELLVFAVLEDFADEGGVVASLGGPTAGGGVEGGGAVTVTAAVAVTWTVTAGGEGVK